MKKEDVEIGMRVTPFQKTAGYHENSVHWNNAKRDNQPYLFVSRWDSILKCFVLSRQPNIMYGDFFNAEDFDLYEEKQLENNVVRQVEVKDYIYDSVRQNFSVKSNLDSEIKKGSFPLKERKKRVIHNKNYTIVILEDGTKGIAKCMPTDKYDKLKGIKIAYYRARIKSLQKELDELCK